MANEHDEYEKIFGRSKRLSPDTAQQHIDAAVAAYTEMGAMLDELEASRDRELAAHRERIERWAYCLEPGFSFVTPDGGGWTREVIDYKEWIRANSLAYQKAWWEMLHRSIPNNGYNRLQSLLIRVRQADLRLQVLADVGKESAGSRWSRLDHVREWVIAERRNSPSGSRAAFVRGVAPKVRDMARDASEPLSGDDQAVIETITRWLRNAGVR